MDQSIEQSIGRSNRSSMINQSIDINESIDRSVGSSMNPSLDESSIDESIDRPIEEFNATSTISRQINDPSIDQASDRFIDQSSNHRIDPSINLSSDNFRIHRIGRTRERKYKGERSERARQRFRKQKIKKKYIHPEARACRWRLLAPIL